MIKVFYDKYFVDRKDEKKLFNCLIIKTAERKLVKNFKN